MPASAIAGPARSDPKNLISRPVFPVTEDSTPLPLSSYFVFQRLTEANLATLQVKITYIGTQTKSTNSLLFASSHFCVDIAKFRPFWRKRVLYWNESDRPAVFYANLSELRAVLSQVGALGIVTDGPDDSTSVFSFALYAEVGGIPRAFERLLDRENAAAVLSALRLALATNERGTEILRSLACRQGLLRGTPPTEVTDRVRVEFSEVPNGEEDGRWEGRIRLTNLSDTRFDSPLIVVIDIRSPNLTLVDRTPSTCLIIPYRPYIVLTKSHLAPGASIERRVRFSNPDNDPVRPNLRVFAGPGDP